MRLFGLFISQGAQLKSVIPLRAAEYYNLWCEREKDWLEKISGTETRDEIERKYL